MSEKREEVFSLVIYSDGTFQVDTKDKKITGNFVGINPVMAALTLILAGTAIEKKGLYNLRKGLNIKIEKKLIS